MAQTFKVTLVYDAVPADGTCEDCAGQNNDELCSVLPDCTAIIWVARPAATEANDE